LNIIEAALMPLIDVVILIIDAFMPLIEQILPLFVDIINLMAPIITTLIQAFMPLISAILKPVTQILEVLIPIFQKYIDTMSPLYEKVLPPLISLFTTIIESALMPLLELILPPLIIVIEALGKMFEWLMDNVLKPIIDVLARAVDWFNQLLGFNGKSVNMTTSVVDQGRASIPGQAKGGVTAMAGLSWVGEKGPELMSMPRGATVTPIPQHMRAENMFASGGQKTQSGNYITINVNGGLDSSAAIGEAVVTAIRKYERTSGPVFVRA
jgi:phage-related protein